MIVVDIDIIAYLLINGEHTARSEALFRADPEWAVPLVWRSEWRNILRAYLRKGHIRLSDAIDRTKAAQRLVRTREFLVDDGPVLGLSAQSSSSAYRCDYVALAAALDVPLITNDGDLQDNFPDRAMSPQRYLEDAATS